MQYPVYVISLAKDEERRNSLKKQFNSYNEFNIINAVEGNKIDIQQYFKYLSGSLSKYNILISPNELGCTLSHIKAYEAFLATDAEYCLILEDDVLGSDETIKKAFSLIKHTQKNSLVLLGGGFFCNAWGCKVTNSLCIVSKPSLDRVWSTASYIMDRECAKNLLEIQSKTPTLADIWAILLPQKNITCYYSPLFTTDEENLKSHIVTERAYRWDLNLGGLKAREIRGIRYYFSDIFWDKVLLKCRKKYVKFRWLY